MKTTTSWREEGPDVVTIARSIPVFARLLSVPFLYFGGKLLYLFLDAAVHPSAGELTIVGAIGMPILAAALIVPGWAFLTVRRWVRIDATRREATDQTNFLVYTHSVTTPIPRDAHVMLRYEVGSRGEAATTAAHVYLVPPDNAELQHVPGAPKLDKVRLAMFFGKQTDEPLELAQKVARFLGLDVRDLRVEGGEVTAGGVVVDRLDPDEAD